MKSDSCAAVAAVFKLETRIIATCSFTMPVPSAEVTEKVLTVVEIDGEVNISDMGAKHLDGTSGPVAGTHGLTSYEPYLANNFWLRGRNIRTLPRSSWLWTDHIESSME